LITKGLKNLLKIKNLLIEFSVKRKFLLQKKKLNKINFFSNRFAAKESFAKALGTGFRNNLNFKDIEIVNDKLGKPFYLINNKIKQIIKKNKKIVNFELFLSISDEKDYSIAFTIIQKI
jgi:holo-[acyl-carrier protein] synthase